MTTIEGRIEFNLPETLVKRPHKIKDFFPPGMFAKVVEKVDSLGMGPDGHLQYHTMIGRWESSVDFDEETERFCIQQARTIFGDDTLQKAYFFVCRYQIQNGCVPNLWEHTDQNGTQTTIDVAIENTANWNLLVEREEFTQEPNSAMIFAGQQHMHARPAYPTDDENAYTTVLFLHFTQPEHWIQKDNRGISRYGRDGDVRYFNRNRFMPMPDPPVEQPICQCHDYANVLQTYDFVAGEQIDSATELVDMSVLQNKVVAPGIVVYDFSKDSARVLKGLTQNFCFKMWESARVLNEEKTTSVVNYDARKCFTKFISEVNAMSCHPQDPQRRLWMSLEAGISPVVEDFRSMYSLRGLDSVHWQLTRYEQGNMFHDHVDDCLEFPRVVSVSVILNDDYEGGDLFFKHQDVTVEPKAGRIVVFDSSFAFMHRVNPIKRGIRYAAVKWYAHKGASLNGT